MTTQHVWRNTRPKLTIELLSSRTISNCYYATIFRITSTNKLTNQDLNKIRDTGIIGFGQEFRILSQCDGTEEPVGTDIVKCVEVDDTSGEIINENPISYSGKPYKATEYPYYVYKVEDRVDSSD